MADKSSREIERDLENQRDELRGTIDEALNRMTVEEAWNQAGKYLRDHSGEHGRTMGSIIKEKPLAVGLVAVGMAWIMFGPSNAARQAAREDRYGRDDRRDDAETRRRLEAGDFDDTTARGPTGREARPDPWAAPSRTPSPTPAGTSTGTGTATTGARTGAVGGTSSPTTSTSTTPGGTSSTATGTSSGAHSTRGTGDTPVAAPAVAPASTPTSTTGTTSTGSTGSGTDAGVSDTSYDTTTSDPKSSKL